MILPALRKVAARSITAQKLVFQSLALPASTCMRQGRGPFPPPHPPYNKLSHSHSLSQQIRTMTSFQTDECNTVLAAAPVAAEGSVKQPVRVAVGQMTAVGSTDQNFSTCAKLAQLFKLLVHAHWGQQLAS